MNKYEISIWEDFPDIDIVTGKRFLNERKIVVIGSDTMDMQARALSPNLVEDVNGTHTFTFEMKVSYTSSLTGEMESNPFIKYLFNERKIKVNWQNKWYDFVIKKCSEDSSNKTVTYTCTDLFINELSKNGYSLEFDNQLQNNIGTAAGLAEQVLQGSSWQYNENMSTPIIQKTKGPVYEVMTLDSFEAIFQGPRENFLEQNYDESSGGITITIPKQVKILVFYDSLVSFLASNNTTDIIPIQFLYNNEYITDINNTLVVNGHCHVITTKCEKIVNSENQILSAIRVYAEATDLQKIAFLIPLLDGISKQYTGEYLVRSRISVFDSLLNRYVLLCKNSQDNNDVYEIATTQYINPTQIINLVTNPKDFTNTAGWSGANLQGFELYPDLTNNVDISDYNPKSYIKIDHALGRQVDEGYIYNAAFQSNANYFQATEAELSQGIVGGLSQGEKYILRFKLRKDSDYDGYTLFTTGDNLNCGLTAVVSLYNKNNLTRKKNQDETAYLDSIFTVQPGYILSTEAEQEWIELVLICNTSVSANNLKDYALFIRNITATNDWRVLFGKTASVAWIEEIQFFKESYGVTSYADDAEVVRINPGQVSLSPYVKPVYKYYVPDETLLDPNDLECLCISDEEVADYIPQYNNYEKIGTISLKESNRFNLLQTIAETFQAWVHFEIEHEDNGAIKFINGVPQKYVYFTSEIGQITGIVFEYGIDLKTIQRDVVSDNLATKIIVNPNNNEYAINGFCSIARSPQNYTRENFIINLDYFLQQHLIDEDELNKDLYNIDNDYIGYYYYLSKYNTEYDSNIETISKLKNDRQHKEVEQVTYEQFVKATIEALDDIKQKIMNLANTANWDTARNYVTQHISELEISTLWTTYQQTNRELLEYQQTLEQINNALDVLNNKLTTITTSQKELLSLISAKHKEFNDKYGNYLMEGTWQNEDYIDDTHYYLDAVNVAFTSSRPQVSYNINVLRLSYLEPYSSKVFGLGDICYIQDKDFFGYLSDGVTPYKERILVNKISSFFDDPSKDSITVQNYKTRFDDLFQRIAAAAQSLQYSEGSYKRAANAINTNGTIDSSILKNTFETNNNFVMSSSNQNVTWDETGITITDKKDSGKKTKIIAGGLFITEDGGMTWKNAISGSGISANILTAGTINTNTISIYDSNTPSFKWDKIGLNAYYVDNGIVAYDKFLRFDKFGIYGYDGDEGFVAQNINDVKENANFGLTWDGLFIKTSREFLNSTGSNTIRSIFEISSENSALTIYSQVGDQKQVRVRIGLLNPDYLDYSPPQTPAYGLVIYDETGGVVFSTSTGNVGNTVKNGTTLGGCNLTANGIEGGKTDTSNGWVLTPNGGYMVN